MRRDLVSPLTSEARRHLYARGRPGSLARLLNRAQAGLHSAGIGPKRLVTLEVDGRRSGKRIHATLSEFAAIAPSYPVFRITTDTGDRMRST
jgi:hypothetical protein